MAAQSQDRILVAEAARSRENAESMEAQTEATVQRLQAEAKFKIAETEEQLRFKAEEARESQREHERQVELENSKRGMRALCLKLKREQQPLIGVILCI